MGCCVIKKSSACRIVDFEPSKPTKHNSSMSVLIQSRNLVFERKSRVKDNYTIISKLGEGSFGAVYKVREKSSNIMRAMKVIKKETLEEQDDEQVFLKEIEILKSIDHPNIVKIFEYYSDECNYFVIIEFVTGGELYSEICTWKIFSERKAALIAKQILSALFYLHSLNIVHRDIKPENVMIEHRKTSKDSKENEIYVKLIDFGTCNYLEPGNFLHQTMGTPYFVAPEVLEGKYNEKCDIWSMGVTLYLLLCGFPPFTGKSTDIIFDKIKKGDYSFNFDEWKKISKNAKDLVKQMLSADFSSRISANDCLQHEWIKQFETEEKVENEVLKSVLSNIKNFNAKEKLQQTTIAYIVHLVQNDKEKETLHRIFSMIDKNNDGRLTYEELKEGFSRVFGESLTDFEFEKILSVIDQDEDGFIGYEEFLRVSMNQKLILSEENLKMAFLRFDDNGDGALSVDEIKKVLGAEDGPYFNEIIQKLEMDKDGVITYDKFSSLMKKLVFKFDKAKTLRANSIRTFMGRKLNPSGSLNLKTGHLTVSPTKGVSHFKTMEKNKLVGSSFKV